MVPAYIHHYYAHTGENHEELINDIVCKFKVKRTYAALFRLYCLSSGGFRPSKQYIQDKTGILKDNVLRTRKWLVDFGLIGFDEEANEIQVDWDHLRALASVPEEQIPVRSHYKIGKVNPHRNAEPKLSDDDMIATMQFISEVYGIPLTFNDNEWDGSEPSTDLLEEFCQAG